MVFKSLALLLSLTAASAFVATTPGVTSFDFGLQAEPQGQGSFMYTGGTGGSSLVSHGRVDVDAPWGSNNPNLHSSKPYSRRVQRTGRQQDARPGTTGGANGSTFVSDFIEKDSLYGSNYHRAQGYGSRPRSMRPEQSQRTEPALPPPQETVRAPVVKQQQQQRQGGKVPHFAN